MRGVFVTGTDTDCGKTWVACRLMEALRERGRRVAGFKPVAAGARPVPGGLENDDARALRVLSDVDAPYAAFNPYCFAPPIAPHIAAAEAGVGIDVTTIVASARALAQEVDFLVVEGAGGWKVPLGEGVDAEGLDMEGVAQALGLPVVLVVGMRLGCLNHALLTAQAVRAAGLHVAGWVANCIDRDMPYLNHNIRTLEYTLPFPLLCVFPHQSVKVPLKCLENLENITNSPVS